MLPTSGQEQWPHRRAEINLAAPSQLACSPFSAEGKQTLSGYRLYLLKKKKLPVKHLLQVCTHGCGNMCLIKTQNVLLTAMGHIQREKTSKTTQNKMSQTPPFRLQRPTCFTGEKTNLDLCAGQDLDTPPADSKFHTIPNNAY